MREIDIRGDGDESQDCTVKVRFGEDGEFLKYSQGEDTFLISDGGDNLYVWVRDLAMLRKAIDKLEEFVVQIGEEEYEENF